VKSIAPIPLTMLVLFSAAVFSAYATPAGAIPSGNPGTSSIAQDGSQSSNASSIAGNWQVSWTGRDGNAKQGTMRIQQKGSSLTGTFQAPRGSAKLSGNLQGNQVSIAVKAGKRDFSFSGTVDGDNMSGTTNMGSSWSASRQ